MFGRQERIAILLLLVVAGVVVASHLALGYLGKRPFAAPYTEESENGDLVLVTGTIDAVAPTRTGGHLILTVTNHTVFLPNEVAAGLALRKGMNISVIGTVQVYQGKRELAVLSANDISSLP